MKKASLSILGPDMMLCDGGGGKAGLRKNGSTCQALMGELLSEVKEKKDEEDEKVD